jgi:hypothetical protein
LASVQENPKKKLRFLKFIEQSQSLENGAPSISRLWIFIKILNKTLKSTKQILKNIGFYKNTFVIRSFFASY